MTRVKWTKDQTTNGVDYRYRTFSDERGHWIAFDGEDSVEDEDGPFSEEEAVLERKSEYEEMLESADGEAADV